MASLRPAARAARTLLVASGRITVSGSAPRARLTKASMLSQRSPMSWPTSRARVSQYSRSLMRPACMSCHKGSCPGLKGPRHCKVPGGSDNARSVSACVSKSVRLITPPKSRISACTGLLMQRSWPAAADLTLCHPSIEDRESDVGELGVIDMSAHMNELDVGCHLRRCLIHEHPQAFRVMKGLPRAVPVFDTPVRQDESSRTACLGKAL